VSDARTAIADGNETDPIALVFPGQGSQSPGMGRLVYQHSEAARLTYEEASDVTQIDLTKLCFESDAETLSESRSTQPAMLTTSVAMLRAMREKLTEVGDRVRPRLFGGHSLGLFSAAVACEAISFRDALLVILERARLMGEFYERRPVGMASILGLSLEQVEEVCDAATVSEDDRVDVANHNQVTQFVISGDLGALERAMERARELRGRAIQLKLKVSSHTPLHREQSEEGPGSANRVEQHLEVAHDGGRRAAGVRSAAAISGVLGGERSDDGARGGGDDGGGGTGACAVEDGEANFRSVGRGVA